MEGFPTALTASAVAALLLAGLAWWGDHRRMRRSQPDAVGFMPWTAVFFWAVLAACIFCGLAVKVWLAG